MAVLPSVTEAPGGGPAEEDPAELRLPPSLVWAAPAPSRAEEARLLFFATPPTGVSCCNAVDGPVDGAPDTGAVTADARLTGDGVGSDGTDAGIAIAGCGRAAVGATT